MNFQTVSTAQKLPTSDGLTGGYEKDGETPGPLLRRALDFVDREIGAMAADIEAQGLAGSTAIIVSAKHGQSPKNPADLTRIDDGPIIDALNAAWTKAHPGAAKLVEFSTDDDIMQLWLSDRSAAAAEFARSFLLAHDATGNTITGGTRTLNSSGLTAAYAGAAAAHLLGVSTADPRHPDVVGIVQHGVVYTGGTSKIAEHGGADPDDRDVPLLVSWPSGAHGRDVARPVGTTSIAPTILRLLGLNPRALQAVREQHTPVLPQM
jgi:arylsulfatase A-like enzyme